MQNITLDQYYLAFMNNQLKPSEHKRVVFYPDMIPWYAPEIAADEYKTAWQNILNRNQGSYLYTDGYKVYRVNALRGLFERLKGWLGMENHCHPARVKMVLAKFVYFGYVNDYKYPRISSCFDNDNLEPCYRLPTYLLQHANTNLCDNSSVLLQKALYSFYKEHETELDQSFWHRFFNGDPDPDNTRAFSPLKNYQFFGQTLWYLFKIHGDETIFNCLLNIDPQNESLLSDLNAYLYNRLFTSITASQGEVRILPNTRLARDHAHALHQEAVKLIQENKSDDKNVYGLLNNCARLSPSQYIKQTKIVLNQNQNKPEPKALNTFLSLFKSNEPDKDKQLNLIYKLMACTFKLNKISPKDRNDIIRQINHELLIPLIKHFIHNKYYKDAYVFITITQALDKAVQWFADHVNYQGLIQPIPKNKTLANAIAKELIRRYQSKQDKIHGDQVQAFLTSKIEQPQQAYPNFFMDYYLEQYLNDSTSISLDQVKGFFQAQPTETIAKFYREQVTVHHENIRQMIADILSQRAQKAIENCYLTHEEIYSVRDELTMGGQGIKAKDFHKDRCQQYIYQAHINLKSLIELVNYNKYPLVTDKALLGQACFQLADLSDFFNLGGYMEYYKKAKQYCPSNPFYVLRYGEIACDDNIKNTGLQLLKSNGWSASDYNDWFENRWKQEQDRIQSDNYAIHQYHQQNLSFTQKLFRPRG